MCKKSLLMMLLLALLVPWAANAQTSLFSEGFEGGSMPSGWTTDGPGTWSVATSVNSTHPSSAGNGTYCAQISHGTTGNVTKLITPEIDLSSVTSAELSFMHVHQDWYGDVDGLKVYYRTSSSEAWTMLQEYTNAYASWTTEEEIVLPNPSSTYQIAFEYIDNYGYGLGIDAVSILPPAACPKPTNLAVTTDGANATVTWEGTAASYNIEIDGAVLSGVTSPYTFRVELSTTYTVRVQASCDGEISDWTNPVSFTTPDCLGGHSIDYTLTDSYGDGWNGANIKVVDACGNIVATLTVSSGTTNSGTLSLCGEYYEFVWHTGSYDSECSFTFSEGGTVLFTKPSSVSEGLVLYTLGTIAMPKPTALAATPGSDVAELSWDENGTATAWQICLNDDETNLIEANSNPYTLTGLTQDTDYSVKVRSIDGTNVSCWSDVLNFSTIVLCPAPTDLVISDITASSANVAWTGDGNFEMEYAIAGEGGSATFDFEDGTLQGWTNLIVDATGGQWLHSNDNLGGYDYTPYAHGGTGFAMSYSFVDNGGGAFNTNAYLVSPNRYQIGGNASLNFWYDFANDAYPDHMEVCVATVANPTAADFTPIWSWDGAKRSNGLRSANGSRQRNNTRYGNWTEVTLDLNAYAGQNIWIAFHHEDYDMYEVWVDDITVNTGGELTWIPVGTVTSPYTFGNLEAETTYLVRVRTNCGDEGYSAWLQGSFTTLPLCMVPTNLVISNIDKRSADLAWTANGDEEAWQIEISDSQNPPVVTVYDVTTTSFTLPGLQPETRYTVRVRAVCDEELQSAWSSPVTFTTLIACPAPTALAISNITNVSAVATWTYDGDVELEYAEDVWKHYDNGVYAMTMGAGGTIYWGMMLPAESLTAGEPLTKVALHTSYAGEATLNVYLGGDQPTGTPAATQTFTMAGDGDFMEITLDTPVAIDGTQNLWITFYQSGLTYPADGCTGPTDPNGRWVSLDGEEWADIAGYGYDYTWMIRAGFGDATTEWVAVNNPASPQTIAGLTPETSYFVRLRAVCGGEDGESVWVNTSFTTDVACPAPTALAATPYALSAELSWEGVSESYTVSYRTAAYVDGDTEEFATTSAPTGWTRYNTLLTDDVLNGTTALSVSTSGWYFGNYNGVFDNHARLNIYGTSCYYWLVTPAMEVSEGSEFGFDLALTAYSGSNVPAPATNGTDDKFVVLVSTDEMATWTILRQWDNAGSEYVYNNIANTATGENVSFDFSAYAGQTVYVAFYGESTTSNADNNLHIDNVALGTLVPAGEWMPVTTEEAAATLTGLTAETKYEWKVQGDCGEYGLSLDSEISTFTTTDDLCPVPTNLAVDAETLTATTADLSWNGSPDVESFTVRYRSPEHVVGGMSESFNSNSVPAGWTRYSGLVNDVIAGTATLTTTTSGWYTTEYALGTYNMKVNIYGNSAKYWLVTPEVTLSSGNFSFDLALTDFNNSDPIEDATAQADDRFVVLVYANDAWTILREWNNTGSDYVYNTIATEGEAVSIDLSAYVGQTVKIAFYGESTASGGDNDLHIDNVVIDNPQTIPATDWMTVENITDMNVTLTGLTPETPYEAQVKADCSDPEAWSNTVTFTTPELTTVTQTIALEAGWNWFSTYVEITLDDLKAALVESLPGTSITIKANDNTSTTYNNGRWRGSLSTLDIAQMYKILVSADCEIALEGMLVDPTEHAVTIINGANWIGFPLSGSMTVAEAFAGFAVNGDVVKNNSNESASYINNRWRGSVTLEPGQGYIYNSAASESRIFVFPTSTSKAVNTSAKP